MIVFCKLFKINNESTFNPSEEVEILKIDNSTNLKLEPDNVKKEKKRVTFNIIEEAKQQKQEKIRNSNSGLGYFSRGTGFNRDE